MNLNGNREDFIKEVQNQFYTDETKAFLLILSIRYGLAIAQIPSKLTIVDQFGYTPDSQKIEEIKDPSINLAF